MFNLHSHLMDRRDTCKAQMKVAKVFEGQEPSRCIMYIAHQGHHTCVAVKRNLMSHLTEDAVKVLRANPKAGYEEVMMRCGENALDELLTNPDFHSADLLQSFKIGDQVAFERVRRSEPFRSKKGKLHKTVYAMHPMLHLIQPHHEITLA